MKSEYQKVFEQFVTHHGGAILVWAGPEGCGKSSRIRSLQNGLNGIVQTPAVFFSQAIGDFCRRKVEGLKGSKNAAKRKPYEDALKKMEERRKDIDPTILTYALRHAISFMPRSNKPDFGQFGILSADGCLRLPDQVGMAINAMSDFIAPYNPTIIVELQTSPQVAFARAMARRGATDTEDNIRRSHQEFGTNMALVLEAAAPYVSHVKVDVSADESEVNDEAVFSAICLHLENIMNGRVGIKTLIPAELAAA